MQTSELLTLLTVLVFAGLAGGTYLNKFNGRKEIFNIDLVQFIYLFLLAPIFFIWAKTFLFYLLKNELGLSLSIGELFAIDTFFSILMMYLFVAIGIHSLTKTFSLRRREDPDIDIYNLSEYFHWWWSHLTVFGGVMVVLTFISLTNLFISIPLEISKWQFVGVPLLGGIFALVAFISIWSFHSSQKHDTFLRVMKILFAFFFIIHAIAYLVFRPHFDISYGIYWFVLSIFLAMGGLSVLFERVSKADELVNFFKHD